MYCYCEELGLELRMESSFIIPAAARDVLDADAEGGDELLHEVERVRRDGGVRHALAVVEGDDVALGEALAQLAEHLLVPVLAEPNHLVHDSWKEWRARVIL